MMTRIRNYITQAFKDVPKTKKATELQEELISNLLEKYNDQLKLGKTEEEAYTSVIANIGDLSELTEGLRERHVLSPENPNDRRKSAMRIAFSVMLFIMSPMALILSTEMYGQEIPGLVTMFALIAIGVGLLIYNAASKPRYLKEEESMIEEFKEFKAAKKKDKAIYDSLSAAFWMLVLVIYFYYSFTYGTWAFSWIIFIVGGALHNLIEALVALRQPNEK